MEENELSKQIEQLCNSKAEEFLLLGYKNISGKTIWECVSEKYSDPLPEIHKIVNDILTLKATSYMNWITMKMYKSS